MVIIFILKFASPVVLERYHRELLNFLTRQVSDRDTAADLTQESFARVLTAQQSGQAVLDLRALLYRTARNLVIDQHRRREVRQHDNLDDLPESDHPQAPQHLEPDAALASQQVIRAYVATIEALPPRCREAFVLHIFDELSQAQIAQRMGISVSMVEKHVVRGMVACKLCERALRDRADVRISPPRASTTTSANERLSPSAHDPAPQNPKLSDATRAGSG